MKTRFAFAALAVATLTVSSAVPARQFEHPDLKSGKKIVRNVLVLPAQVQIVKSGVKGAEPLVEESQKVETTLPGVMTKVLQGQGCTVLENPFTPQALEKNSDLKYALADLQTRFDALREQLDRKSKDVRQGRFSLGDEVARFNPGATADALVFVRGEGVANTGGKKAFSVLFGVGGAASSVDHMFVHAAVVDAQSGAVLYYGKATVTGNFADPEKLAHSIEKSFKNFVGPPKTEKKPAPSSQP